MFLLFSFTGDGNPYLIIIAVMGVLLALLTIIIIIIGAVLYQSKASPQGTKLLFQTFLNNSAFLSILNYYVITSF